MSISSLAGRILHGLNPVKRPKLVAGAAAVIAALGVYLGLKISDLNFGAGGGGGLGLMGDARPNGAAEPDSKKPDSKPASERPQTTADVVEVVIEGDEFALRKEQGEDVRVPLEEVIALARAAAGNRDGIRVRVYRRGSALPTAEEALQRALDEAGIGENAVQMMEGQLD